MSTCLANQKVGQPCLASDGNNIRALHTKVDALKKTIDANHGQVMARFDQVENLLNQQNLSGYGDALRGVDINGTTALTAWDAVLACMIKASSPGATCGAYIGGSATEAPQPTAEAINETLAYMQGQITFLPTNIDVTASYYTGTKLRAGLNGVAYWSWWSSLREQDQKVDVSRTQGNPHTPIITRDLAQITRQSTTYYANIFQQYGYLMVLGAQLKNDGKLANSYQATVDRVITGTAPYEVMGTVKQYLLPGLAERTMIVLHKGKALKVSAGQTLDRPLDYATIATVATEINSSYGGVNRFIDAFPNAIGAGGWYVVRQHVRAERRHVFPCPVGTNFACPYNGWFAVQELADSGSACNTRVRIWGETPGWERDQKKWMESAPPMGKDFFLKSYERYVTGPANYDWARKSLEATSGGGMVHFGFGSWIHCTAEATGTQRVMSVKPEMLG